MCVCVIFDCVFGFVFQDMACSFVCSKNMLKKFLGLLINFYLRHFNKIYPHPLSHKSPLTLAWILLHITLKAKHCYVKLLQCSLHF